MGLFDKLFGKKPEPPAAPAAPPAPTPKLSPPAAAPKTEPPKTSPPRKLTVLVVEDEEAIAALISEYLESNGARVYTAGDGWEAAIKAEGMKIDLIITDIMMPGPQGSGYDAYKKIRLSAAVRKDLPVIFLTALPKQQVLPVMPKDDPNLRVLFKPLDFPALRQTIRDLTGR